MTKFIQKTGLHFKQVGAGVKRWAKNEQGFEVFEKFGLTQGGVLLALGVVAVAIWFMSDLWKEVGGALGDVSDMTPSGIQTDYAEWITP